MQTRNPILIDAPLRGGCRSVRSSGARRIAALALLALAAALAPIVAAAQRALPLSRPGDERPALPDFEPPEQAPGRILPPVQIPSRPDTAGLSGGLRVHIREVRVVGNTVLSDAEIAEITRPYEGRELSYADLLDLSDALTLAYASRGYVSSGAVLPEQSLSDGVVEVWAVEGKLAGMTVETDGRFRESYIRKRLQRAAKPPVNVNRLEEALQILQQDPRIERIDASLLPTEVRGESWLQVRVSEASPYRVYLEGNNYEPPSVSMGTGLTRFAWGNLTGFGDSIELEYTGSNGLQQLDGRYEVPLTEWDTSLALYFEQYWSEVIEDEFEQFDIESRSQTYGVSLSQPVYRTESLIASLFLAGEWRRSKTYALGHGFQFVPGPSENGVSKLALLRFGQEAFYRSRNLALAARSTLTFGLDVLGATKNPSGVPDGQFFAWLGQIELARRFALLGAQIIARADVQLSDSPLLGLEQFAIGGHSSVRGYHENALVRDNGLIGSLELRVPVFNRSEGIPWLEIGPFVDAGYSWNEDRDTDGPTTLVGVGIGARVNFSDRIRLVAEWGEALKDLDHEGDFRLQDYGVHLSLGMSFP
jgi:hemolysin activation/secretion protein